MIGSILLFATAAAAAEILGGVLMVSRKQWPTRLQETLLSLGAGFILALVFFKLIPLSFQILPSAAWWLLMGYATLHFFEHTVVGHLHFGEEVHSEKMISKVAGFSAFAGLFIHAFFDGFSISVGVQYDFLVGVLVFIAVLLHKFPEGLTIGSIMLSAGFERRKVIQAALGIGTATVVGACSAFFLQSISPAIVGGAFAFSAGTVLYVGASDLIPEINKTENRLPPFLVFAGMVLFYVGEGFVESLVR
jgi:zinc transporter ZupT